MTEAEIRGRTPTYATYIRALNRSRVHACSVSQSSSLVTHSVKEHWLIAIGTLGRTDDGRWLDLLAGSSVAALGKLYFGHTLVVNIICYNWRVGIPPQRCSVKVLPPRGNFQFSLQVTWQEHITDTLTEKTLFIVYVDAKTLKGACEGPNITAHLEIPCWMWLASIIQRGPILPWMTENILHTMTLTPPQLYV